MLLPVVERNPRDVNALLLLANAESPNPAAAVARYRQVLEIDGNNLVALNNLAFYLAREKPDEALKLGQRALEIAPENPGIQDTLGWIYYRKGVYLLAAEHLKAAVKRDPTPLRQFHLALAYQKAGDDTASRQLMNAALRQDPGLSTERGW